MLMEKNETYTATCEGYNEDGAGVVKIDGFVIFVNGLIEHETAEIGITKLKKNYGYGRIVRLITPSEHRVTPVCPVAKPCGGCQLQHMDDAELAQRLRDEAAAREEEARKAAEEAAAEEAAAEEAAAEGEAAEGEASEEGSEEPAEESGEETSEEGSEG